MDLKAARLLPKGEVEDSEDLALLEARDLLFARLLQYRAFKQIAALMQERMAAESKRFPRAVGMEARFAELLPEVLLGIDPAGLAALAARALAPKTDVPEGVSLAHLHAPAVTVREQALVIVDRLRRQRSTTFRALVADSPDTVTTVCRFLALLELFREAAVTFDQVTPLGELDHPLDRLGRGRDRRQRRVRRGRQTRVRGRRGPGGLRRGGLPRTR